MKYNRVVTLKSGESCRLRNAEESDAQAVLDIFNQTHAETDYLLTYPDENTFDAAQEGRFLKAQAESANEIEIVAEVNGEIAGTAGIEAVGGKCKLRHRADFGIAIARKFWGRGIGRALTEACMLPDTGARNVDSLLNQQILPALSQQLLSHMAAGQKPRQVTLGYHEEEGIVMAFDEGTISDE